MVGPTAVVAVIGVLAIAAATTIFDLHRSCVGDSLLGDPSGVNAGDLNVSTAATHRAEGATLAEPRTQRPPILRA